MRRKLEVVQGKNVGEEYDLVEDEVLVGRGLSCRIAIIEPTVSRQHARLVLEGGTYVIEDLKSRHHTYVNGRQIHGPVPLKNQDRIKIGDTIFIFHLPLPAVTEKTDHGATTLLETIDVAGGGESTVEVNAEAKLRAILRITQALGRTLELDALLPKMLDGLFEIFPQADRALVLLVDGDRLVPKATKHRLGGEQSIDYSKTIVKKAIAERQAILSEDAIGDERFPHAQSIQSVQIRSVMCVPLLSRETNALGVIQLDTQRRAVKFSADDMHILASVACQAAVSLEYAQLHEEMLKQAKLQQEMDIAHDVQHSFLPTTTPELEGYRFWAYYLAAGKVGGDYYDFLHLPNGSLAALLGDVSGKGVPAALMMAKASAVCKVSLLNHADNVAKAMNAINEEVCEASVDATFVTLVLCVINPSTHEITIANAGHMAPMFRRSDGSVDELADEGIRGFPLGIAADFDYSTTSTTLAPGESVVLFSDGISEAVNSKEDLYSIERVREQLLGMEGKGPAEIGDTLLEDVRRHAAGCEQADDMSLVVFQRVPG